MKPKNLDKYLKAIEELETDKKDLKKLGLSEEEIEGYIDFYRDTFFPEKIRKELD
jgi:hypothetical protein